MNIYITHNLGCNPCQIYQTPTAAPAPVSSEILTSRYVLLHGEIFEISNRLRKQMIRISV